MSQTSKKTCIQKRIKSWFSNLRFEDKLFLVIAVGLIFSFVYIYRFLSPFFLDFVIRFTVGFLGILIGFYFDRQIELRKKIRISRQITNSLLVELNNNLDLVKQFKSEIKLPTYHRPSSSGYSIRFFNLFQTSAWTMFSSRLELDAIEVLYELGATYHKFGLFNEAVKNEPTGFTLETFLREKPKFLEKLEKELEEIISVLESLRI